MMKKFALFSIILLLTSLFAGSVSAQSAEQVTISPANPTDSQTLTCLVNNGFNSQYTYVWRVNPGPSNTGPTSPGFPGNPNILDANAASAGDVVSCEVRWITPFSDTPVGFPVYVTILPDTTTPPPTPVPEEVTITPENPVEGEDLSCWVNDGYITSYTYLWSVNSGAFVNTGNNVFTANTNANDVITCQVREVTPLIDRLVGSAAVTVAQVLPGIPDVEIVQPANGASFVEDNLVTFVATASDPNNNIVSWSWDFGDNAGSADVGTTSHTYANPGTYTVSVTVTDADGNTDSDSIAVNILGHAFDIEGLQTYSNSEFDIQSSSFFRGEDLFVKFTVVDHMTGQPVPGLQIEATLNPPAGAGIPLQPFNGFLGSREAGPFPVPIDLFDSIVNGERELVCFPVIGCNSGPDGTYYYELPEVPVGDNMLGQNMVLVIAIMGPLGGQEQIGVEVVNNNPVIGREGIFGLRPIPDQTTDVGQTGSFDLNDYVEDVEDADGQLIWSVSSNNVNAQVNNGVLTFSSATPTSQVVTLTVRDTDGGVDAQDIVLTSAGASDDPVAAFTVNQMRGCLNTVFAFTSTSTDDGAIVSYNWNFGDIATAVGTTASHSYAAPGVYPVTLEVIDDDGNRDTVVLSIAVDDCQSGGRPDPNEGRPRKGAGRIVNIHDLEISGVRLWPFKPVYNGGDVVQLFLEFRNEGNLDEQVEVRLTMIGMNVPVQVNDQRVDVADTRLNSELGFVVPKGTQPGVYVGKVEAFNKGGSERAIEYFTITVQ